MVDRLGLAHLLADLALAGLEVDARVAVDDGLVRDCLHEGDADGSQRPERQRLADQLLVVLDLDRIRLGRRKRTPRRRCTSPRSPR